MTKVEKIWSVVRRIPRGKVATYGQIAALAGWPRHARYVGFALRSLPEKSNVPWHRVVGADGRVSCRSHGDSNELQRILLEAEGVKFDGRGRLRLEEVQWDD